MSKNNDIFKYRYIFTQYISASILYISIHFDTRYRYFMLFRTSLVYTKVWSWRGPTHIQINLGTTWLYKDLIFLEDIIKPRK